MSSLYQNYTWFKKASLLCLRYLTFSCPDEDSFSMYFHDSLNISFHCSFTTLIVTLSYIKKIPIQRFLVASRVTNATLKRAKLMSCPEMHLIIFKIKLASLRSTTDQWLSWLSNGLPCGRSGGGEFDSGRTNTQGLKITEEKVLPL